MRVRVTFEFTEDDRLAVAQHYGEDRPASYAAMKRWADSTVDGELETLGAEAERREWEAENE